MWSVYALILTLTKETNFLQDKSVDQTTELESSATASAPPTKPPAATASALTSAPAATGPPPLLSDDDLFAPIASKSAPKSAKPEASQDDIFATTSTPGLCVLFICSEVLVILNSNF